MSDSPLLSPRNWLSLNPLFFLLILPIFLNFFLPSSTTPFICLPSSRRSPSLPVCGKSHQWAPGADVQVSGGDQHSYPGETGPGGEGGPPGGAQRQLRPGPRPSGRVRRLKPEPVCLWRPDAQWRTDCTRRETWWMNSSSPPPPIISSLLLLSPFLTSPHTPPGIWTLPQNQTNSLSCSVSVCVLQDVGLTLYSTGSCRYMETFLFDFPNASIHLRCIEVFEA